VKQTLAYYNGNGGKSLFAIGEQNRLRIDSVDQVQDMQHFIDANKGNYIFVALSYDLKEAFLDCPSQNSDYLKFPKAFLWVPQFVAKMNEENIATVVQGELTTRIQAIIKTFFDAQRKNFSWDANIQPRISKEDYLSTISQLQEELQFGNIYEVNFCQEYYDDKFEMTSPFSAYFRLNSITQAPFSAYLQFDEFNVLCGSPERFLKREGKRVISQPIKGTRKRGVDLQEDKRLKAELQGDPKERAENVMIVDLVRNDLSRIAEKSSVHVDELFGVYSFKTVHQLISTVVCEVDPSKNLAEILNATFPMGSMTGAPKRSAVSLIEKHENFQRGLYSGSLGYITPSGDFDLNVVIRTIIYNSLHNYLSCAVGGAITIQSNPEAEFEECQVKVKTILDQMYNA
jgi:para-aminobenzoate synthetase component 1